MAALRVNFFPQFNRLQLFYWVDIKSEKFTIFILVPNSLSKFPKTGENSLIQFEVGALANI